MVIPQSRALAPHAEGSKGGGEDVEDVENLVVWAIRKWVVGVPMRERMPSQP
jgi:hypothetical protein